MNILLLVCSLVKENDETGILEYEGGHIQVEIQVIQSC